MGANRMSGVPRFDDFSEFFDGETPGDEEDKTDPAPVYSSQVSEEPVKRADVHKHIQPAPKKRMSAGTATFLAILTVAFIGFLAYGIVTSMKESQKKEAALQDCEQRAIAVCERYGLQNVSADAAFRQTQYILYCDLTASADGVSDLEFQDQYELMKKLEEIEVEYEHWSVMKTKLTSGGSEYCLNPDDEYTLQIDGQDAYVDLFEADRRFRAELRYDEIYVGLEERYIDSSWYGRHDHVEYCEGFDDLPPQERTVTYSWDYPNGDTRIEAVVGYWDDETGEETDGEIIEIIHHEIPYEYVQKVMATPKPTPKRSYSSSTAKDTPSDPYDVYDYSDPDDFYYDHYDDFFDYEDAEDYFYEHDD